MRAAVKSAFDKRLEEAKFGPATLVKVDEVADIVKGIVNSLEGFDKSIEDAAVLCGASPLRAKLKITLPAIRIGLFSAAIFAFLISWDEVVVAIFMASPDLQTLPVRIWGALRQDLTPVIAAASTILVAFTLLVMAAAALLRRRISK